MRLGGEFGGVGLGGAIPTPSCRKGIAPKYTALMTLPQTRFVRVDVDQQKAMAAKRPVPVHSEQRPFSPSSVEFHAHLFLRECHSQISAMPTSSSRESDITPSLSGTVRTSVMRWDAGDSMLCGGQKVLK